MKARLLLLFAAGLTNCQSRTQLEPSTAPSTDSGVPAFPIGTFTTCAQGVHNPNGNVFPNAAGFESGATLTLTQSENLVTAIYVDQNGSSQTLTFSATTSASATLAEPGRLTAGLSSLCVMGPSNQKAHPAAMDANAGALTYDAGVVFVTLTGSLESDAGDCGLLSVSDATYWLLCEERSGGALAVDTGPPPEAEVAVGQYSCSSQVETYAEVNGMNHFVAGGGAGTLKLTQDGSKVTAEYAGDASLTGTLRFDLTTATTAPAEAGQALMAPCMVPTGMGGPSQTPEPLPVVAASFTVVDATVFLSFAGTMGAESSCPDAKVAGSVICPK